MPTATSSIAMRAGRRWCSIASTEAREFGSAVRAIVRQRTASAELLPSLLTEAVVSVLPADGAGLTIRVGELGRVPIGASDHHSARAESLEFTVGEGPCLDAITFDEHVEASLQRLEARWPLLADSWSAATPFRSVASTPVQIPPGIPGALNLYFEREDGVAGIDRADVDYVASRITIELAHRQPHADDYAEEVQRSFTASARGRVWIAVGVLMATFAMEATDALDRVRSVALSRDASADDLADDLLHDRIDVAEFSP